MKCENCEINKANVKYTQIINGDKKKIFLCEECSKKLGIGNLKLNIPINFLSFLGEFFDDMHEISGIPSLSDQIEIRCKKCGLDFDEFLHTGNFRCNSCYDQFESMIDPILKNIQDSNRMEKNNINKIKEELKKAIKEERYEEAAILRDKIEQLER